MSDLNNLYQQVLLDHNKNPRNFRIPARFNRQAEGYNPVCGDLVVVYLQYEQDIIQDIGFQGTGCAISRASASVMTELLLKKDFQNAEKEYESLQQLLSSDSDLSSVPEQLRIFSGVRKFPIRRKCALLPWETFQEAISR